MAVRAVGLIVGALAACTSGGEDDAALTTAEAAVPVSATTAAPPVTELPATAPSSPAIEPIAGSVAALDVLAFVRVENEHPEGYDRERFGHAADADGDGCNTRAKVLVEEAATAHVGTADGRCEAVSGEWTSRYDGAEVTDPNALEVDHVVALKEAHDSGAWAWDEERLRAFANDLVDPRTLRAVTGDVNREKGDADPTNWLPSNPAFVCEYLADWVAIKVRWGLSMDESEHGRIRNLLTDRCPGQLIAPWPETPPPPPPPTTTRTTTPPPLQPPDPIPPVTEPPPTEPAPVQPAAPLPAVPGGNCDPSYPTVCIAPSPPDLDCGDITFRRFPVLPPDPHRFDGDDDDGVGCESD